MATITEKANKLVSLAAAMKYTNERGELDLKTVQSLAYGAKKLTQSIISQAKAAERRSCQHEPRDYPSADYSRVLDDQKNIRIREYRCKNCGKEKVRVTETLEDR